ncbi:MAG: CoA transferase, partial [Dehalococcoidia bacterium]
MVEEKGVEAKGVEEKGALLSPYRVLDLSDRRGFLCGKILGDLGADVIKVEPPGGEPSRNIGPYYHDEPDPEKSLYWYAFNTSKRGITLDLKSPQGVDTFRRLVEGADIVIESSAPGHMEGLGLGYPDLEKINPGIVMTSITPFGQTGPHRDFKASDIVVMALGGQMYCAGDEDRPPVRISVPQAALQAGAHGAVGTMIALHHSQMTGQGQHVDVSMQEGIVRLETPELPFWEFEGVNFRRWGPKRQRVHLLLREVWPCRDGHVAFRLIGGGFGSRIRPLVEWMDEEGMAGILKGVNWETFGFSDISVEDNDAWEEIFGRFFLKHTKAEINEQALSRGFIVLPGNTPRDTQADRQLEARDFWVDVEHPELGASIRYPGAPIKLSRSPWRIRGRAPLIGEHNEEVFADLARRPKKSARPRGPSPDPGTDGLPLAGITVVDFTWQLTGPFITKYLGDYGARVVRVEAPNKLDVTRLTEPFKDKKMGVNRAGFFPSINSSKYSITLDLNHPRGMELIKRLIAKADVVVENFAPGQMAKWGLAYPDLARLKPDIVMVSTSAQGQTGPHARQPGFGWNLNGLTGFNHVSGWPDRDVITPNVAYTDHAAPWYCVVAALAALDHRRRTGEGLHIDQSQYEAGLSFLSAALLEYTANGHEAVRQGNRSPCAAPHGAFRCRGDDRWCTISVFTQEEWEGFARVTGHPGWTREPRFATMADRKQNEDELEALVAVWTLGRSAEEVMALMQAGGVAAGVVQNAEDILDKDPQLRHRGHIQKLDHTEMGPVNHYA